MLRSVCEEEVFSSLFSNYTESLVNYLTIRLNYLGTEDIMPDSFVILWKECNKLVLDKTKSFLYTVRYKYLSQSNKKSGIVAVPARM